MVVLGSTGSIGVQTLEICEAAGISVEAISCAKNVELLNAQIAKFRPKFVCVGDEKLVSQVAGIERARIFAGASGILEMLEACESDTVVNALVGFAGLMPSIKTQRLGKKLALANKESLVTGGKFLDTRAINPIDSEHFGLKFLLQNPLPASRLIITASGGAFYKTPLRALKNVTPSDALKHPNWSMGAKITIDSATMANKLFEVMEAYWLYAAPRNSASLPLKIDALIEPASMIHALVEFIDGSTSAHISRADMKLAIAHAALGENLGEFLRGRNNRLKRGGEIAPHADLLNLKPLKFGEIDLKKYPIFSLKDAVLERPDLGVAINAANEAAVFAFLRGECGFLDISRVVLSAAKIYADVKIPSEDEAVRLDEEVRKYVKSALSCGTFA